MTTSAGAALAALVSISVAPDVPPELSAVAVRSCDTALGEGRCEIEGAGATHAEWHATVTASDPALASVRVEVRKSAGDSVPETRELSFSPEDAARERWASVGVLIAALVVAASREPEPSAPPPEVPAAPPIEPPPTPARPPKEHAPRTLRFDLRALAARRTSESFPEFGIEIGASMLPGGGPWFASGSAAGARRFGADVGAAWLSVAIGGGARIGKPTAQFATEFRGAMLGEYWRFDASEPGRSEHTGNFRLGGLLGIDALWALHSKWILSLGLEGMLAGPRLRVEVEGRTVETVRQIGLLGALGMRFIP